jgi:hypothetical protein
MFQIKQVFLNFQNILKVIFQNIYFFTNLFLNIYMKNILQLNTNAILSLKILRLIFLSLLIIISNSCAKADVTPSLSDQAVGIYIGKILRLGANEIALPLASRDGNTFDARFEVSKATTADKVNFIFIFNQKTNGVKTEEKEEYTDLILQNGKNNDILLTENGKTVATVKAKLIDITFEVDGVVASFIGERP